MSHAEGSSFDVRQLPGRGLGTQAVTRYHLDGGASSGPKARWCEALAGSCEGQSEGHACRGVVCEK